MRTVIAGLARSLFAWTLLGWLAADVLVGLRYGVEYLIHGSRFLDSDATSFLEAMVAPMLFFAPGSLAAALIIFLPAVAAMRAVLRDRLPGIVNGLILGVFALVVIFALGVVFWWTGARHTETFMENLARTGPFHVRHIPFLLACVAGASVAGWGATRVHPGGSEVNEGSEKIIVS